MWVLGHKVISNQQPHPPATLIGSSPTHPKDPSHTKLSVKNRQTAEVNGGFPWSKAYKAASNRADVVLFAQL